MSDETDFEELLNEQMAFVADTVKDYALADLESDGLIADEGGKWAVTDLGRARLEEWRRNS